jgi:hypothetical protein
VYGGALRVWARRARAKDHPDVQWAAVAESNALIDHARGFEPFIAGVERIRDRTIAHLENRRAAGRPVVGYGAPARAVTFLNALRIGPDLLPVTADRAVSKQGRVIPGVEVPIVAPEALRDRPPSDVLVLNWDLAGEIRIENAWIQERGGRMLVAVPELAVV